LAGQLDIVFAFASLLHLNKSELQTVFTGVAKVLKPRGIFYISSKYRPEYAEEIKEDTYGKRLFYFYNAELLSEIAGSEYETAKAWREVHANTEWFELALRKSSIQI
jgi:SAM-dependent methyltransferase